MVKPSCVNFRVITANFRVSEFLEYISMNRVRTKNYKADNVLRTIFDHLTSHLVGNIERPHIRSALLDDIMWCWPYCMVSYQVGPLRWAFPHDVKAHNIYIYKEYCHLFFSHLLLGMGLTLKSKWFLNMRCMRGDWKVCFFLWYREKYGF